MKQANDEIAELKKQNTSLQKQVEVEKKENANLSEQVSSLPPSPTLFMLK